MVKECLTEIVKSRIDLGDRRKQIINNYLDIYDENQLSYIMQSPVGLVTEDLFINYLPGVGFRCNNNPSSGRLPICNIYQRIMNEKYKSIVNENV